MEKLRVGYACFARLSFDGAYAKELHQQSLHSLAKLNITLVHEPDLTITEQDAEALVAHFQRERVDVVLAQYGTFSLGTLIPIVAQRLGVPIILWGVPEPSIEGPKLRSNSFCGINMNAHTLTRLGHPYDYIFCRPEQAPAELESKFRVLATLKNLRSSKIGLVGYRVPGFYTSTFDELGLRRMLGVEVHHISLAEVFDEAARVAPDACRQEADSLRVLACHCECDQTELDKASALLLAYQSLAEKYHLNAYAIKCWPEFPGQYGVATCSAISRLNDQGIMASCEGDVWGTVSMLIQRDLTSRVPMFADFIAIDEEKNVGTFWHCGSAASCLAENPSEIRLCKHSTVEGGGKKGVTVEFPVRGEGPVTVTRLATGPTGTMRMFLVGGEAVPAVKTLRGNAFAVRFRRPVRQVIDTIIRQGLEHHTVVVHGDTRDELRQLARWIGVEVLDAERECQA